MTVSQYDVVVVGAGCAGLTAAIGLARAGFAVAVVEAAKTVGGAGMLGGVCFADGLIQPDILGPEAVEALAWERRLIERGSFATDGRRIAGSIYRDADAFRHCYSILRSHFTQNLAELAHSHGVEVITETTVESLIRNGRRIIGVATTHGPLYAQLVYIAEGDAGLLVSREGLDRFNDPRDQPGFLYCLQQIVELPPRAVEEFFRIEADEGVAYNFLLRNPAELPLNARGLLCTNRQGLTLSVVLPASNLQRWFRGAPRQLLDWLVDVPVLRPWLREGRRGSWTAALLRTGGLRDVPYLIEDGLAIGGAAAGLGIDFPTLNLMGPAMATAVLLSRAAARIRAERRSFDRDSLARYYLEPLKQDRSWRDMVFVQRWPGYVERTQILFGHGLDLLLDSASVWARARRWPPWKLFAWLRVLSRVPWDRWNELRDDLMHLGRVLRLRDVTPRTPLARLLLDGALNAFRDLVRKPRPHLPPHGTLRLYYHADGEEGRASKVPWIFRRWFERFRPVLAAASRMFHANDDSQLSVKSSRTIELLLRQINLFDFVAVAVLAFPIALASTMLATGSYAFRWMRRRPRGERLVGWVERSEAHHALKVSLEDSVHPTPPLIRIAWRSTQPEQHTASVRDLPHICPAGVFEITGTSPETVRVAIHSERCIFCQACWRTNPLVDWARNGTASTSHSYVAEAGVAMPGELESLIDELENRLRVFDAALAEGPALVDRPHNDYLEMLAHHAQQLANRIREILNTNSGVTEKSQRPIRELADVLVSSTEERTRRTWEGRFAWAAAEGRLLRQHHLAELRRLLALPATNSARERVAILRIGWLPIEPPLHGEDACVKHLLADCAARQYLLETLESAKSSIEDSVQAALSAELVIEIRAILSMRILELRSLLGENSAPIHSEKNPDVTAKYVRHGSLLKNAEETHKVLDVPGDWRQMERFHLLRAEREEIAESERRLLEQLEKIKRSYRQAADEELIGGFGRQAAHILAGKYLLLHTFDHIEKGGDAELAILLLRVWLDYTATLLHEYTIVVRDWLDPANRRDDRPLVEPDSGAPLRTQPEYLAAPATYRSGDFLLFPLDLLQPRLVPEMIGKNEIITASPNDAALLQLLKSSDPQPSASEIAHLPTLADRIFYLAEALTVETIGRHAAASSSIFDLEFACSRLILAELHPSHSGLRERCDTLRELVKVVIPRWLGGGVDTRARHLERDALELEALKADFRRRLMAAWEAFGEALARNADVQASCFALAEAAAWLKAADSALGRMAWLSRLCQAEDREEPVSQQNLGPRALAHCFAEIRDRLFRFDEDLASLRRGYYAPHVYAAAMLLRRETS